MKTFTRLPVVAAVIGLITAAAAFAVSTSAAQAAAIDTSAWYQIVSRHSGKVLDVDQGSTDNGAAIVQWTDNDSTNQQFRFLDSGDGYYRIQARHSGKVIDVYEASTDNGADLVQWTDNGGANQQFQVVDTDSGYVKLINRNSGKALDVWERSTADGARVSQYDDTGGDNQQWRLVEVDGGDDSQQPPDGERQMEDLGRGVVAVRSSDTDVLVSWRLLGLDPDGIGFNVYRSTDGGSWTKLNGGALTGGTDFVDDDADLSRSNRYRVAAVIDGAEQEPSEPFELSANHAEEPVVRIPMRDGGAVKFAWVGDLDGDGDYDYVVDRQTSPQSIEAYTNEGEFLWEADLGHNSTNQDNIEPGSATIDVGHNDGVTVQDLDGDGRAEVALRIADGVTFGDGETFEYSDDDHQFIAILDGQTGAALDTAPVPDDYIDDGPLAARFGVGYLDGVHPSLVAFMKNRIGNGGFNLMMSAWSFDGDNVDMQWKWLRGSRNAPDGHNSRIIDVDGDGKDEVVEIGFVLNGDGTLRYSLGDEGIVHGDRYHIADMDPSRPGLEGYGVQQRNPSGLLEYYYDASTGEMLWKHYGSSDEPADVGRGMAGDIDPRFPGMEVWSFSGLYNAASNELTEPDTSLRPWPQLGLWWDGDITMELLNSGKIEQWDPEHPTPTNSLPRLESTWNYGAVTAAQGGPTLVGDLFGDWREEAVYTNADYNELIIFTTDVPTDIRLYTLAHNPAYRNAMTEHGYMQSHHVDYFLGAGMEEPETPNITY
ncbi:RICIN domain-containing protein [Glycomyces arizonensis]|uniref:rhamnogalacturonan lyase family protein n=1 Tax=Glycomyces arizonensis TaxID=256035 RepID=UPI00040DFF79|nr:RICIN domain-containing protein [Glycomyces arizonensis]